MALEQDGTKLWNLLLVVSKRLEAFKDFLFWDVIRGQFASLGGVTSKHATLAQNQQNCKGLQPDVTSTGNAEQLEQT